MATIAKNLNNRIQKATNKITGSKLKTDTNVRETIRRQTNKESNKAINRSGINIPPNDFDNPEYGLSDPFENPVLLTFILLITFGFIAYGLYHYYRRDMAFKQGQTFYGSDVLAYEPIFTMDADKVETCVARCQKDSMCQGITFNSDTLTCTGAEEGRLRDDSMNYISWVKPDKISNLLKERAIGAKPLIGLATGNMTLKNNELPRPPFISRFNFSLFLYINDFYEGHGKWRNIICKGSEWPQGDPLDTPYWENVSTERPEQCLGIWLAPFNNNLRVCVTTRRQTSTTPGSPKSQSSTIIQQTLEYIDIPNIPTRKLVHLSVNMVEGGMEIYLNGKLHRMQALKGAPIWNELPLTILGPISTPVTIMDLVFLPDSADLDDIRKQSQKLSEYAAKLM